MSRTPSPDEVRRAAREAGQDESAPRRAPEMPRLDPLAYRGPIGDLVVKMAPYTEADPAGLLLSLLAAVGGAIGDAPHVMIGGSPHPPRIWPLIIGRTGSGRKGESWAQAERIMALVESGFIRDHTASGLSTGEGLIACFVDEEDQGGNSKQRDKRLLIIEPEFGRTLGVSRRESNTLSQVLRGLWESGRAAVLTRTEPLRCRGAHLVVIGHITPRELLLKLSEADVSGGLINRFLPILVKRPHLLPDDIDLPQAADLDLKRRIAAARKRGRVRRNDQASKLWREAYHAMAEDEEDGPLGEILARGPAYAQRLALLYALLDGDAEIGTGHLRAGLAVWQCCAASARQIFAHTSGHSDRDRLADFLAEGSSSRTRTEVRDFFGRNKPSKEIDALLEEMERAGDIACKEDHSGKGRPVTRLSWAGGDRASSLAELLRRNDLDDETIYAGQDDGLLSLRHKSFQGSRR